MKRCPECGFRANDTVCPLCGVRMQSYTAPIYTHTHAQSGEKCALPNQRQAPVKPQPSASETYQPRQTDRQRRQRGKPNFGVVVFIIIMFILLRSCAWL